MYKCTFQPALELLSLTVIPPAPGGSQPLCPCEFELPLLKGPMLELWIYVLAAWYLQYASSSHLKVGYVTHNDNGEFAPAGLPRHTRREVTFTAFYCVLMERSIGKYISI